MSTSQREIELFTEALQLSGEERAAFLGRVCAQDDEQRRRIEALLSSSERTGGFLEDRAGGIGEGRPKFTTGEAPGDSVDRYKLLQQIGEGGCGVVFVAEQQTPVLRRVALKVVKPGMDTKSVIARFEAERQALALMDHPNIAHVFDAGATEHGRPYFVMELVEGVKITEYCDQHSLPIGARLDLFVQVCDAIQHAHQKGIIHRDIKPSNIMVTAGPDGRPVPKVIDFGIAKAIAGVRLTDKTIFTGCEMLIGTPAYMSPEQATLASIDADTRTDVYSLGVLLYELLTGTTPFDTIELFKAGLDKLRRVILQEEPVRPSVRLSTMMAADLKHTSRERQTESPKLIRDLHGDLDWIVMKALEKDRAWRYQTASALAEDIHRYRSDETVSARPPSVAYKVQKLVARHKVLFGALSVVLVILLAGLAATVWSLGKEKRARQEADLALGKAEEHRKKAEKSERTALDESARSQQVTDFLKKAFSRVHPIHSFRRDTTLLREIVDDAVKNIDRDLADQPAIQADIKMTLGGVYGAIGRDEKGEPLLREALAYYRNSPAGAEHKLAELLGNLALSHARQSRYKEAEQEAREALAIETKLQTKDIRIVKLETQLAWIIVRRKGRIPEAEELFRKALATGRELVEEDSVELLDTKSGLGTALNLTDQFEEAEKVLRDCLAVAQKKLTAEHPYVANAMYRLGFLFERQRQFAEAEPFHRECVALRRKALGVEHPLFDEALAGLGRALRSGGKLAEAAEAYRELLGIRRKRFGDEDNRVVESLDVLTFVLIDSRDEAQFEKLASEFPRAWRARSEEAGRQGRWPEAMAAASRYLKLQPGDPEAYYLAAPLLVQTGERAAYEKLCEEMGSRFAGAEDASNAAFMAKYCLLLSRPGADLKVPMELAERALNLGANSKALHVFQACRALAEYRLGRWEGAAQWARQSAENSFPYTRAESYALLAMSQHQLGQNENARATLKQCDEVIQNQFPKLGSGVLGLDWRGWISARALRDEAGEMIEGAPGAARK